nr:unnamed protein product [Spirometra erinaceieuropaei]
MAAEQQRKGCPVEESVSGLLLQDVPLTTGSGAILCDVSTPFHRPFVPASMRRAAFQSLHGPSHPGIRASQKLLAERFAWHEQVRQIMSSVLSDLLAQQGAASQQVTTRNFSQTRRMVQPCARGCRRPLASIQSFHPPSYLRRSIPLSNVQAESIVKAFASRCVAMFVAPSTVTIDRDAHF